MSGVGKCVRCNGGSLGLPEPGPRFSKEGLSNSRFQVTVAALDSVSLALVSSGRASATLSPPSQVGPDAGGGEGGGGRGDVEVVRSVE